MHTHSEMRAYALEFLHNSDEGSCNALFELFDCFKRFRIYLYDYVIY